MSNGYRIEPAGPAFIVIDPWGEKVNTYPTKEAAKKDIETLQAGRHHVRKREAAGGHRYQGAHADAWR